MSRRIVQDAEAGIPKPRQRGYVYQKGKIKGEPWNLASVHTVAIVLTFPVTAVRRKSG